jgi:pSer/pThr/pTyr-binding forkhead associated (FHA) protein
MVSYEDYQRSVGSQTAYSVSVSAGMISQTFQTAPSERTNVAPVAPQGLPVLTLYNQNLNIRIQGINGAVIGRRQGPYVKFFEQNMYVSGVHAQLKYNASVGWCIVDKHSSNGTKLNQRPLQPDVEMSLKTGDIVSLANVNLQVTINQ